MFSDLNDHFVCRILKWMSLILWLLKSMSVIKYENKEKHKIHIKTLMEKKTPIGEKTYESKNDYKIHQNRE